MDTIYITLYCFCCCSGSHIVYELEKRYKSEGYKTDITIRNVGVNIPSEIEDMTIDLKTTPMISIRYGSTIEWHKCLDLRSDLQNNGWKIRIAGG
jgi:hypothetical protein